MISIFARNEGGKPSNKNTLLRYLYKESLLSMQIQNCLIVLTCFVISQGKNIQNYYEITSKNKFESLHLQFWYLHHLASGNSLRNSFEHLFFINVMKWLISNLYLCNSCVSCERIESLYLWKDNLFDTSIVLSNSW